MEIVYFGILGSAAKQRPSIVPVPPPATRIVESCGQRRDTSEKEKPHARNYTWAPTDGENFRAGCAGMPALLTRRRVRFTKYAVGVCAAQERPDDRISTTASATITDVDQLC